MTTHVRASGARRNSGSRISTSCDTAAAHVDERQANNPAAEAAANCSNLGMGKTLTGWRRRAA